MKFVQLAVLIVAVVALFAVGANAAPKPEPVPQDLGTILEQLAQALANLLSNDNNSDPEGSK